MEAAAFQKKKIILAKSDKHFDHQINTVNAYAVKVDTKCHNSQEVPTHDSSRIALLMRKSIKPCMNSFT